MSLQFTFPKAIRLYPTGTPYAGALAYFYAAGTLDDQAVYQDSNCTVPHSQPVVADDNGYWRPIYLNPNAPAAYRFIAKSSAGALLDDEDDIPVAPFTGAQLAIILNSRTASEISASVTPSDYSYEEGDIRRYGAIAGSSIDCTIPIQNAVNVAQIDPRITVKIPEGTFKVTDTIVIGTFPVNIRGAGKFHSVLYATGFTQDKPILSYPGTLANVISSTFLRGLILQSDNNLASGIHASYWIFSNIEDIFYYQLYNGFVGATCYTNNAKNTGAFLVANDTVLFNGDDCNNWHFDKCRFVGTNGFHATAHAHAIKFTACDFEGGVSQTGAGVKLEPTTGKIIHGVTIDTCYFENNAGLSVKCAGADAASVKALVIKGNYITGGFTNSFLGVSGNATNSIKLTNVSGFDISENYFEDFETAAFILDGSERNGRVWNNTGASCPSFTTGSAFYATVSHGNNFGGRGESWSSTSPVGVLAGGVGDIVWNTAPAAGDNVLWACTTAGSPGTWKPFGRTTLEGTANYDPASLIDAAGFTTTVTVTGAALGDYAMASFSLDLQGILLTAYVSAADTVSVRFQNESTFTVDLGAGVLKARVIKQ